MSHINVLLDSIANHKLGEDIYVIDRNFTYLYLNQSHKDSFKRYFGIEPMIGSNKITILPSALSAKYKTIYESAFSTHRLTHLERFHDRIFEFSFYCCFVENNEKILIARVNDITEEINLHKEIENYRERLENMVKDRANDLLLQRNFLQEIINKDPNYIFVRDIEGNFILANQAISNQFGMAPEEVVGKNIKDLHYDREGAERYVREDRLIINSDVMHYSYDRQVWNDQVQWTFVQKKKIEVNNQKYVLGVITDVTDLKQSQVRLERINADLNSTLNQLKETQLKLIASEKIASVGQLMSGLLHEINNPINYVGGNIEPLSRDFEEIKDWILSLPLDMGKQAEIQDTLAEIPILLKGISEGAHRVKRLANGIKDLVSSQRQMKPVIYNINTDLQATVRLLLAGIPENIKVEEKYSDEIKPVLASQQEMQQVYLNIMDYCINQLKKRGGIIRIQTEYDGKYNCMQFCLVNYFLPHEEVIELLDPFSRTDRDATQLSLGLAISYRIIHRLNGEFFPDLNGGMGLTLTARIPPHDK